jgi:hypothetical protein
LGKTVRKRRRRTVFPALSRCSKKAAVLGFAVPFTTFNVVLLCVPVMSSYKLDRDVIGWTLVMTALYLVSWMLPLAVVLAYSFSWRKLRTIWHRGIAGTCVGCGALVAFAAIPAIWSPSTLREAFIDDPWSRTVLIAFAFGHGVLAVLISITCTIWCWVRDIGVVFVDAPLCEECDYDLTGNESMTCPECGTPLTLEAIGWTREEWSRLAESASRGTA